VENYKIRAGDVFEIEVQGKNGDLTVIAYKRMIVKG
jgi:hypothetical protein